jgi:putative NIF3 family GTP cyclohydrolase 1 type 2
MLADVIGIDDTVPIEPLAGDGRSSEGLGRMGTLKEAKPLGEIVTSVKEKLGIDAVRVLGDLDRNIKRIATCGGSGGSLIGEAEKFGSDLLITGDIRYHQAREAEDLGISLIDAGHFSSEKIVVGGLAKLLRSKLEEKGMDILVREYDREEEPFKIL